MKGVNICFKTMIFSLVGGAILGVLDLKLSIKGLELLGRGLFVIGLIALPLMFFMMALNFKKEQDKKLALSTLFFAISLLAGVFPLIIKLCT